MRPEGRPHDGDRKTLGSVFYRNSDDGVLSPAAGEPDTKSGRPWGLSVGDLNADGFEDVFVTAEMSQGSPHGGNSVLLNDGDQRFHDSAFALGFEARVRTTPLAGIKSLRE